MVAEGKNGRYAVYLSPKELTVEVVAVGNPGDLAEAAAGVDGTFASITAGPSR
jgi:hypothetical protein